MRDTSFERTLAYENLVERAAVFYAETGMIDIEHAAEAASLGVFIRAFTEDVNEEAAKNYER